MILKRLLMFLTVLFFAGMASTIKAQDLPKIYFFYGEYCPHCALVEKYFEENRILEKYPVESREIYSNKENALAFNEVMEKLGIPASDRGVPAVVIGDKVIVGDRPIIEKFVAEADIYLAKKSGVTPTWCPASETPTVLPVNRPSENRKSDLTILANCGRW